MRPTRRALLAGAAAAVAAARLAIPSPAGAAAGPARSLIDDFTGGTVPAPGRVALTMPDLVENGNSVPVAIAVDSPLTADDHVETVLLVAFANPLPGIARFVFTPAAGTARISTRIRLAATQEVMAIARMSDGNFFADRRHVEVVVGGCAG